MEDAVELLQECEKYMDNDELSDVDRFNYYENVGVATTFSDPLKSERAFKQAEEYINKVGYDLLARHIINSQIYPNADNSFMTISALDRVNFIYSAFIKSEPRLFTEILYLYGHYYLGVRNYAKAQDYLESAYKNTFEYADSDPFTVRILQDLTQLCKLTNQPGLWKITVDALMSAAEPMGHDSDRYLNAVSSALDFALSTGDLASAEEYLTTYSALRPDDFDTNCYRARFAIANSEYTEAENILRQLEQNKTDGTPDTSEIWKMLYAAMRHPDVAIYARRSYNCYRDGILRQLLFMSTQERNNLKDELSRRRDDAVSLIEISPEMIDVAMDYSLLIKGLLPTTQSKTQSYLSSDPEASADWNKLCQLRKELNRAISQGNENECNSLRAEIASRERYILNDYVDFNLFRQDFLSRSVDTLRNRHRSGTVYIDFVDSPIGNHDHYGAFIIDASGKSHFVTNRLSGNTDPEVWSAFEPYLTDAQDVYFCPDGRLTSMPIEYELDKENKLYTERYRLHRVFHLSDINSAADVIGDYPVAIGVADHNSPIGKADRISRGNWTDLPQVKQEISQFRKILASRHPKIIYNDEAIESRIKRLDSEPVTALHISTHGFYRDYNALAAAEADAANPDHYMATRLLAAGKTDIAGLVLRRGNLSWKSPEITDPEDDILTAEEIEQMSFPNLQLTVLSACETGLGETDPEGVWGLQRAFRIAGSKNLICSLKKVDDYWAAQFMEVFYEQAEQGQTIYDSFHTAQQWLRHELPDNPEIWKAFILIE